MALNTPDYPKVLKRLGLVFLVWIVVFVAAVGLLELLQPAHWVVVVVVLLPVAGFVVAFTVLMRSVVREDRERRVLYSPVPGAQQPRVTVGSMVRAVGIPGFVFSCLAMLGLPVTLIGAVSHLRWLLVVGLVLLFAELVDQSVIWPARRARRRSG